MYVHLFYPPDSRHLELLQRDLDDRIVITTGEDIPPEVQVLVAGRPSEDQLDSLSNLRILIVPWVGIPEETLETVKKFPNLKLHNLHHNAAATAELALALLFAAAKRVIPFDRELRIGNWELRYAEPESLLLAGKRALLVGHGQIGRRIETALEALGVEVSVISRTSALDAHAYSKGLLHQILPKVDFLMLAVPLTEATEGMIGAEELALLPDRSILINVSRGKVVDQSALYKALKENLLFGAGLDVWYNYPAGEAERTETFPGDFPFHELENLVLSPHRAGLVRETEGQRMKELARLLNQAAAGDPLDNLVDTDLGY